MGDRARPAHRQVLAHPHRCHRGRAGRGARRRASNGSDRLNLSFAWPGGSFAATFEDHTELDVRVEHEGRLIVLRDRDLPRRSPGTYDVRGHGVWLSVVEEEPGRWTVGLEAFGLAVEHPDDERGDLVPLGLDVEVEGDSVIGEVLVGDARLTL